jgi:tetratricopeptide (TPR) repeat protein
VGARVKPEKQQTPSAPVKGKTRRLPALLMPLILLAGAGMCAFAGWNAVQTNGQPGFPLDDPWIHLQFARNLLDYGAFSYYKNEMVTSGSTSPLYTLILAAGFLFTSNEFLLSYILGVVFLLLSAFVLYKLARRILGGSAWGAVAALLLLFEPRLQWAGLSGMETTLFILAILAVTYFYQEWRPIALGISAGLAVWIRPEALIFFGVLALDTAYRRAVVLHALSAGKPAPGGNPGTRWFVQAGIIALCIIAAYAAFNLRLSGSVFPNTLAAKTKYYALGRGDFPAQVLGFLTGGHLFIFSYAVCVGGLSVLWSVVRRRREELFIALLWPAALFLAYWKELPYLYQEGRYLMPVLPFIILLGLRGVETIAAGAAKLFRELPRRTIDIAAAGTAAAVFGVWFGYASWQMKDTYAEECGYISDRQVRTAKWIHDHLPAGSVVGTHDVGAIAYYSGARIVDMVGLVSPEMIENIGSLDKLNRYLIKSGVTHLALLRNWFEVVNQNALFGTDESHPEIMEVFQFDPARTHITPRSAGDLTQAGLYYLAGGNPRGAIPLLERSLAIDPGSSKTHYVLGRSLLALGERERAGTELKEAVRLHPQFWDARTSLAEILVKTNRPDDAIASLEELLKENPSYAPGCGMLAELYATGRRDTVRAANYRERYARLLKESGQ